MARSVGKTMAASVPVVDREGLARRAGQATAVPANDGALGGVVVERRIASLLVAEYRPLIAYSRWLTGNSPEAVDLVHIVFARVLAQPMPITAVGNPSGWLRTVLFNAFVDLRRRERWEIPTESAALDRRAAAQADEAPALSLTMDDVRALAAKLPEHFRVPYELFTFEQMSYARIAAVLAISQKTVGTRINRARGRLRAMILAQQEG